MDENEIHNLRNRVLYGGYHNPLIEWTLSDKWTSVKLNPREEYCMQHYGRLHRGMAVKMVTCVPYPTHNQKSFSDVVSGEINAR